MTLDIEQATAILRRGGLVAFPTETVYGLGADAENPAAVARIFAAKGRPENHPVIVHIGHTGLLEYWAADIPSSALLLAQSFWPGPLTLILKRNARVLDAVTGGQDTVGLRMPDHPVALALLSAFGGGVAAPSANRFGRISPTTALHVRDELGETVDCILDGGPCRVGIESTILDLSGVHPQLLRPGAISAAAIESVLGQPLVEASHAAPRVPGTLKSHYAPRTPLILIPPQDLKTEFDRRHKNGGGIVVLARSVAAPNFQCAWYVMPVDPDGYARELYAQLRALDELHAEHILIEAVPPESIWQAVRDRLARASQR